LKAFTSTLWFRILMLAAGSVLVAGIGWIVESTRSSKKLKRAENLLRKQIDDGLPLGSDETKVVEFLKARAIFSEGYQRLAPEYRASYRGANAIIFGTTEAIDAPTLLCQIVVTFRFDTAGKLQGYEDQFACNAPF
jgi:hypothetical protein